MANQMVLFAGTYNNQKFPKLHTKLVKFGSLQM